MSFSSDSDFVTSLSTDERIEQSLKEERRLMEENRERYFKQSFDEDVNREGGLLNLEGFNFLKYTRKKIKFTFTPSLIEFVSDRYIFYCTLWYKGEFWYIKRNSFPVNCKVEIYRLFHAKNGRGITDRRVKYAIRNIYIILEKWTHEEHEFRLNIYERFRSGEDIILDGIEEELFLDAMEIDEIHRKRNAILKRMIPPNKN